MSNEREPESHERSGLEERIVTVRERILDHLRKTGVQDIAHSKNGRALSKDHIRLLHTQQRESRALQEKDFVEKHGAHLLSWFAEGREIDVENIAPDLIPVQSGTTMGNLFRFATLLWSVPVSRGFGRRLRFLVVDRNSDRLIGLFALGDPVFNLNVRDEWIGWDVRTREERLVNVMDAYVLGAVPPYSQLIGGKLVAALIGSREVSELFEDKYGQKKGIISGKNKSARLVLVTTTSALGRSSLYNRLKLPGMFEFQRLGYTSGYGHFHIPDELFEELRKILQDENHKYASGHNYGDGPNWRFRVVREGLQRVGLDPEMLRHGVKREAYAVPLADNWRDYLQGTAKEAIIRLPSKDEISSYCIDRWLIPRARRKPSYLNWSRDDTWHQMLKSSGLTSKDFPWSHTMF